MNATFIVDKIPTTTCHWCKSEITGIKILIVSGHPIICEKCYENLSANSGGNGCDTFV